MEWYYYLTNFLANPNMQVLLTVAGLGAFLKFLLVPAVKWITLKVYPKKPLTGFWTVVVVHICALVTTIVATMAIGEPIAIGPLLLVAWAATKDALGIQTQMSALFRPTKL